ncbi:MAG: hypothetical protein JNL74_14015 [Fibrobacteres bacterium]|nr:hypothetical protein [Fibrobacterota bacterium]
MSSIDVSECYSAPPFYQIPRLGLIYFVTPQQQYLIIVPDALHPSIKAMDAIAAALKSSFSLHRENILYHANHNHQFRRFDVEKMVKRIVPEVNKLKASAIEAEVGHFQASSKGLIFNRRFLISKEIGKLCLGHKFRGKSNLELGTMEVTEQAIDWFLGAKLGREYDKGIVNSLNIKSNAVRTFTKELGETKIVSNGPIDTLLDWLIFRNSKTKENIGSIVRFSAHRNQCPQFLTKALSAATNGAPSIFVIGTAGDGALLEETDGSPDTDDKTISEMERIAGVMATRLISTYRSDKKFNPIGSFEMNKKIVGMEIAEDIRRYRGNADSVLNKWTEDYSSLESSECTPIEFKKKRELAGRGEYLKHSAHYSDTIYSPVTVIKMNNIKILGLPGEILCDVGKEIKDSLRGENVIILSLCDDGRQAYVPHPDEYEFGGYEITNSRLSPKGVDMLIGEAVKLWSSK